MITLDFDGSHLAASCVVAGSSEHVAFRPIRLQGLPVMVSIEHRREDGDSWRCARQQEISGVGVTQIAVEPLGPQVRLSLTSCALTGGAL